MARMKDDALLIVGTGALATLFTYRLARSGVDVTMLGTWKEGVDALRKNGARLDGEAGAAVHATDDPAQCREARNVIVLVKAWQTERAAHQLADCLSTDGLAVTLQNGLGNDVRLSRTLGTARVGRGVTTLGGNLTAPGLVRSGGEGRVTLEMHPRLTVLEKMLRIAGFNLKLVEDARPDIWGKLVVNAAINPVSALLRMKNGDLLAHPTTRALLGQLSRETAAVAAAQDIHLPFQDPERTVLDVAKRTARNVSSMLQDVRRGAATEIDAINGAVVKLATSLSVDVPANRVVWSLVKALSVRGKID
jgi:2-dehydropantoate 2-reductase